MGSVPFVKGNNHDVSPIKQGPELESQLSILKLAFTEGLVRTALATALKGMDGICATS